MKMKYVEFADNKIVMFSEAFKHSDVAYDMQSCGKVSSAGFCNLYDDQITFYGKSDSLGIKANSALKLNVFDIVAFQMEFPARFGNVFFSNFDINDKQVEFTVVDSDNITVGRFTYFNHY